MPMIPIYCSNESCKHFGFVSVGTLPRVLTCSCCGIQTLHASPPLAARDSRGTGPLEITNPGQPLRLYGTPYLIRPPLMASTAN
jgi:hypothetical protein